MSTTNLPAHVDNGQLSQQPADDADSCQTQEGQDGQERKASKTSCFIAWIMDEAISIPGTKIKFGLDPLFGLLPGGGDFASSTAGVFALIEAVKRGLPVGAMWKIVGNILLNAGVGTIPIIGDIFSVIFRSNSRNRDVINENLRLAIDEGREPSWWRVVPIVGAIFVIVLCAISLNLYLWYLLTKHPLNWLQSVTGMGAGLI